MRHAVWSLSACLMLIAFSLVAPGCALWQEERATPPAITSTPPGRSARIHAPTSTPARSPQPSPRRTPSSPWASQVTSRDHHAFRGVNDFMQIFYRRRTFKFGDNRNPCFGWIYL